MFNRTYSKKCICPSPKTSKSKQASHLYSKRHARFAKHHFANDNCDVQCVRG